MVNKKILVFIAVLIGAVIYMSIDKVDPLIGRINDFVEGAEVGNEDAKLGKALKAHTLSKYFADTVYVNLPRYKSEISLTREDMKSILAMALTSSSSFLIEMIDPVVISRTENSGVVEAVMKVERAGEIEINHVRIGMVKQDDDWLFVSCEEQNMLEK